MQPAPASDDIGWWTVVDRAKLVLASDLARRWTLAEVASEVRCSPVYLTQVFQQSGRSAPVSLTLQLASGRSNVAFLLNPTTHVLHSVADRLLVYVQSDVIHMSSRSLRGRSLNQRRR
jgi:AraC-like DNA-binding protein